MVSETRVPIGTGQTLCVDNHPNGEVHILVLGRKGARLWGSYVTPGVALNIAAALETHANEAAL